MMRVGDGVSKEMPSGASTETGWLKPRARSSLLVPWAAAR
jgi:hypothetical protein